MAINPNNGVLDIINGVLKVSSIDIKQAGGFTTAINTVARNDVFFSMTRRRPRHLHPPNTRDTVL